MERINREIKRRTDDVLLRLVTAVLFEMRDEWMAFPRRYLPEGSMDEQGPPSFRAGPRGRVMYRRGTSIRGSTNKNRPTPAPTPP